jgi:hypothetical protein
MAGSLSRKATKAADSMSDPPETHSLELRTAFHNAVLRFRDWKSGVDKPRVKLRGRFCPISEVCQEVGTLGDPLPERIVSILYKETQPGDDMVALKMDETYRGGAGYLGRLIENRKRQRRQESPT